ncbi:branched-chain amino acid ABC transporter substrate-binding protein [Desulfospira joergensenii]|uniref:branched-chain amino acid ABC transporter substrate-binding protein n=1 Tax=Desulfospira joergensenii TaxID=53329 RepID=UPI000485E7C0|nr:branched-chain amino acid ABC transporter substrate-binding protein [Desulfospira joergensenii]
MKPIFKSLVMVLFVSSLCAVNPAAGQSVKLGFGGAVSGDLAPYGISSLRGVELALEDINSNGGILGKQVELIVGDDACKPEIAVNIATKLISSGVQMVVGHICSGSTLAANKLYKDARLLLISPSSTNDDLTLTGKNPNFFRTISYDRAQAELMTSYIKNVLNCKKIALIHDKGDYGKGQMELARECFKTLGGIDIVLFEGVTTGAVDFSSIVQKIKKSRAQVTLWGGYHSDASKIASLLKRKRVKTIFFGGDGINGDNFLNLAGQYAEGVYSTGPRDTSNNTLYQELTQRHEEKYKELPGTFFYNAYACVQALAAAAEKAGSFDFEKMRAAMFEIKIDSPLGPIGFDKNGDVVGAGFSVYKVINGKYNQVN